MRYSLYIGSPFGIRITIHWTFLLLIIWAVFVTQRQGGTSIEIIFYVLFILTIFFCVVLHELGHALAARKYGINTKGITLLPIGGMASLDKIPEEPKRELFVAIAGPLVNVGIALLLFVIVQLTGQNLSDLRLPILLHNFIPFLLLVNVMLVIFNLIPAFPMDGGRIFRAILALRINRLKATNIAARTGQAFSLLFAFYGIYRNDLLLLVVAGFVFIAAQAELKDVQTKSLLSGKKVKDMLMKNYTPLNPQLSLKNVIEILLNGHEEEFIVVENEKPVGVLTKNDIIKGITQHGHDVSTGEVMDRDFFTVQIEDSIKDVYEKMQKSENRIAPVEQEGQIVGVIDVKNITEFMMVYQAMKGSNGRS